MPPLGLLFLVPLGDLLENRRLVVTALVCSALALLAASLSTNGAMFLAAALAIGLSSVAAQVLVPFAAHLSKEATRGAAVGKVVSGLLLGIMLARPVASLVADHANYLAIFLQTAGEFPIKIYVVVHAAGYRNVNRFRHVEKRVGDDGLNRDAFFKD